MDTQPNLALLQIGSEPDGTGTVHSFLLTADILELMASDFLDRAKQLRRKTN